MDHAAQAINLDEALAFIDTGKYQREDLEPYKKLLNAITLRYIFDNKRYLNSNSLSSYARTRFNTQLSGYDAIDLLSGMGPIIGKYKFLNCTKQSFDEFGVKDDAEYETIVTATDSVLNAIDERIEALKKLIIKDYIKTYKEIVDVYGEVIQRYTDIFIKLAKETTQKQDKWGDYDELRISELKRECVYKIYRSINKDKYQEKDSASWADAWINRALDNVNSKLTIGSATPYWVKQLYGVDLPKALKENRILD